MLDEHEDVEWERITFVKARVLAGLEDQQTEQRIADGLNVALSTVRTHVGELKAISGCGDVRELGKWWRRNRLEWAAWCVRQAGILPDEGETLPGVG